VTSVKKAWPRSDTDVDQASLAVSLLSCWQFWVETPVGRVRDFSLGSGNPAGCLGACTWVAEPCSHTVPFKAISEPVFSFKQCILEAFPELLVEECLPGLVVPNHVGFPTSAG